MEDVTEFHGLLSSSVALKQSLGEQGPQTTTPAMNGSTKNTLAKVVGKYSILFIQTSLCFVHISPDKSVSVLK